MIPKNKMVPFLPDLPKDGGNDSKVRRGIRNRVAAKWTEGVLNNQPVEKISSGGEGILADRPEEASNLWKSLHRPYLSPETLMVLPLSIINIRLPLSIVKATTPSTWLRFPVNELRIYM